MASEGCSGSFEYSLPFTPSSTYGRGDVVRSPTVVVGKCPVGLKIYPRGSANVKAGQLALSAYVEVRKRDCWPDEWEFPEVCFSIEVKSVEDSKTVNKKDAGTFTDTSCQWGWGELLPCDGYSELKTGGWIFPDNTVRCHVTMSGASLEHSQRKQQETECGAQVWRDMLFTDMVLCADGEGEELPCHRVILAQRSPVFKRMLTSGMKAGEKQRCVIRNASFKTLHAFMEFIYTKSVPENEALDLECLHELLVLADQYDVKDLRMLCTNGLVEIMSPANACHVLAQLGRHHDDPDTDDCFERAKKKAQTDDTMFEALIQNCVGVVAPAIGRTSLEEKTEGDQQQHEGVLAGC